MIPFLFRICFAVPTRFKAKPRKSVTAYKTWDTIIKCDIFGFPSPAITWTRSLKQLPVNIHVIDDNGLIIKNTTEDDDGAYVCQGNNKLGNVIAVTWVFVKDVGKLANVTDQHDRNDLSMTKKRSKGKRRR